MKIRVRSRRSLSECGGLDTALCSPALPAALALSILSGPPARPANTKRCQGHRTPKENLQQGETHRINASLNHRRLFLNL